jgi:hypothetical protein
MPINPFRAPANYDVPNFPTPAGRYDPSVFNNIASIGDAIGAYREHQQVADAIKAATDPTTGSIDFDKATANLGQAGLVRYAEPFMQAGLRKQALQQTGAAQTETARHNKELEKYYGQARVPYGWTEGPDGTLAPTPGGPADPEYQRKLAEMKGEGREKPPSGYRYRTDQPGVLEAIPGGPGEKIAAETAARVGLTKSFLDELNDRTDAQGNVKPGLRSRITSGEMTGGVFNPAMAWAGFGTQGEVRRKVDSGADALLRALTGAGMNLTEAQDYTRRYRFDPRDTVGVSLSKLDQLQRELEYTMTEVTRGHGGPTPGAGRPAPAAAPGGVPPPPPGFIMR